MDCWLLVHTQLSVVWSREVFTHERLILYCSNGKYCWCTDSCPLLGRCPLLGMSVIRGSTVSYMYVTCLHTCHCVIAIYYPCVALSLVHNIWCKSSQVPATWHDTMPKLSSTAISSYCDKSYDVAQNRKKVFWVKIARHRNTSRGFATTCVILWTRQYMCIM